jgi:hypothetical protein
LGASSAFSIHYSNSSEVICLSTAASSSFS